MFSNPRNRPRQARCAWLFLVLLAGPAGCMLLEDRGAAGADSAARIGKSGATPEAIQAQLMSFADTYTSLMIQAFSELQLQDDSLETRRLATGARLNMTSNAIAIAAGKNPVTAMLDMAVMVSLQRRVWEEYWRPTHFADDRPEMVGAALERAERDIWEVVDTVLAQEEAAALRELVDEIRGRYPNQVVVSQIRASEFASNRQESLLRIRGGNSLLRLFGLDPMAGLSPATREIAESRLLGERAFFYATRAPTLLNWQLEDALLDLVSDPDVRRVIDAAEQAGEASRRGVEVAEELSARLSEERAAAIDQMADRLREERELAIEQVFEGVEREREALLARLDTEHEALRATLEEFRVTVDATATMSDSIGGTLTEANMLVAGFERLKDPAARPFDVTEYESAAGVMTEGIRELRATLESARTLLDDIDSGEHAVWVDGVVDRTSGRANEVIDHLYRRGLMLIGVLSACLLGVLVLYRLVAARVIVPRSVG